MPGVAALYRALGLPLALAAGPVFAADLPPPREPVPHVQEGVNLKQFADEAKQRLEAARKAESAAFEAFNGAVAFKQRADATRNPKTIDAARQALENAKAALGKAQETTRNAEMEYEMRQAAAEGRLILQPPDPRAGPNTLKTRPVPPPQKLVEAALQSYVLPPNPQIAPLIMDALTAGKGDPAASVEWLEGRMIMDPTNLNGQEALSYLQGIKESEAAFRRSPDKITLLDMISPTLTRTAPPPPGARPWELNRVLDARNDALRAAARESDGTPDGALKALAEAARKPGAPTQALRNAERYLHGFMIYQREARP